MKSTARTSQPSSLGVPPPVGSRVQAASLLCVRADRPAVPLGATGVVTAHVGGRCLLVSWDAAHLRAAYPGGLVLYPNQVALLEGREVAQ
jgi:hypothetical protein